MENEAVKKYQNRPEDILSVSLQKLTGKTIKDIEGSVSNLWHAVPVFNMYKVIFTDDTYMFMEGEHDLAYPYGGTASFLVDLESLVDDEE